MGDGEDVRLCESMALVMQSYMCLLLFLLQQGTVTADFTFGLKGEAAACEPNTELLYIVVTVSSTSRQTVTQ